METDAHIEAKPPEVVWAPLEELVLHIPLLNLRLGGDTFTREGIQTWILIERLDVLLGVQAPRPV